MAIRMYIINSIEEFASLKNKFPFLRVFSDDLINKHLSYERPVLIGERETKKTLLSEVFIKKPQEVDNILSEIHKAKANIAEYAKDALQNGDDCKIESIRKRVLKAYTCLGKDWYKRHFFLIDKYAPFRSSFNKNVFGRWVSNYGYLIIESKGKRKTVLGKKLANVLYHSAIEREVPLANYDFGPTLTQMMECFSKRYGLVSINLQSFEQRGIIVDCLLSNTNEGQYEVRNADCASIGSHMKNASVLLINCKADYILPNSKNVEVKMFGGRSVFEPFIGAENIKKKEVRGFRRYRLPKRRQK